MNLTDLEQRVLRVYFEDNGCGADTPEQLKEDNMSYNDAKNIAEISGIPLQSVVGVIGSLVQKGLVDPVGDNPNVDWRQDEQVLTDAGIDAAYGVIREAGKEQETQGDPENVIEDVVIRALVKMYDDGLVNVHQWAGMMEAYRKKAAA